jgi:hypothetical protein
MSEVRLSNDTNATQTPSISLNPYTPLSLKALRIMKQLIIFICCTLCLPTAAIAGITNIKHMSRNSNDSFDVICSNGTLETVNSRTIVDNSVCKNTTDKSSSGSKSVVCTGSGNVAYITRISNGSILGTRSVE